MYGSRTNFGVVAYFTGIAMVWFAGLQIFPVIMALIYCEPQIRIFEMSALFYMLTGITLVYLFRNFKQPVSKRQGQFCVSFLWLFLPVAGAFPYMFFAGEFSLTDCFFESFSGFTTTGSTVVEKFSDLPKCLLCYRSLTQWVGGLGFTVLIISVLSDYPGNLNNLFSSEFFYLGLGRIYPRIGTTVRRILLIYCSLTLLCFLLLYSGSMNVCEALCHAFSTVSTGGFSTSANSLADFDSYSQWVVMCFMFLSGISFFLIVYLFQGRFKLVFNNEQLKYYVLLIVTVSICFVVYWSLRWEPATWAEKIKDSLFYSVSIVSSTGYNPSLKTPGVFVSACLLILMFVGGCSASSASGVKVIRVLILFRYAGTALTKIFHPNAIVPVRYNKKSVSDEDLRAVFGFFFLYLAVFMVGIFALCCAGNGFSSSMVMSAANLGNIGPMALQYTGSVSCSSISEVSRLILIILMLLGRLEIYTFVAVFSKSLYKTR
ncbi:MAG: TrkH family potassium uptake protein [Bacteroidales bacterium]|nr:TrkH family potassium uptake protein [Bacteroidales bacterium]